MPFYRVSCFQTVATTYRVIEAGSAGDALDLVMRDRDAVPIVEETTEDWGDWDVDEVSDIEAQEELKQLSEEQ